MHGGLSGREAFFLRVAPLMKDGISRLPDGLPSPDYPVTKCPTQLYLHEVPGLLPHLAPNHKRRNTPARLGRLAISEHVNG